MAITFQYGPAAGAIQLAAKAGQGHRQQTAFGQDMAFSDMVQKAQDAIDRKNAMAIQNALGVDEFNARQDQQQQQLNVQQANRQEEQASRDQEQAANRAIQQQNANTAAKNADTMAGYRTSETGLASQKYQNQQNALGQLDPAQAAMIQANGHLPAAGHDQTSALAQQYRLLLDEARKVQKDQDAAAYDENDMRKLGATPSSTVPGAIAGLEDRYVAAQTRMSGLAARIKSTEQQLANPAASSLTGNVVDPNLGTKVIQQQQQNPQASAPAQQPRIIATATNPQTGEKIGFDANTGRWVKI